MASLPLYLLGGAVLLSGAAFLLEVASVRAWDPLYGAGYHLAAQLAAVFAAGCVFVLVLWPPT